jgi:6-pyruvoyltetrahydropterin/6-carboxytetrahydropterin synthase
MVVATGMIMFTFAKSYRFSAAHTLRSPYLGEKENQAVYGKCANPSGHGHDYILEFRLSSDSLTDDVVSGRGKLDRLVAEHIAPRFDRTDVNRTLGPDFISSGENLAVAAHNLIAPHLPSRIALEVRLLETEKNSFVYRGE